jgi:peptide/nickel transport system substrate-binding protein
MISNQQKSGFLPVVCFLVPLFLTFPVKAVPSNEQVVIGMTQEFESLNPILASMSASTWIIGLVQRPLAVVNPQWQWECLTCKELPTLENGKAKIVEKNGHKMVSVEWELLPNQKWGDGTPITAKDYKLTWEITRSPNVTVASKEVAQNIVEFNIDPKNPLKFNTIWKEVVYNYFQFPLIPIPAHIEGPIWEKNKNKTGSYEKLTTYTVNPTNPGLSSGPYMVTEVKMGSHIIVKKNPHWFGKTADINKIVMKLIPNTQALEASLISGEIDMINEMGMTFDQATEFEKRLERDSNLKSLYRVSYTDGLNYEHIDLNLRNPILADKRVRQAILYAINRKKLTDSLFSGKQPVARSMIHPKDVYAINDLPLYDYDLNKSKELLDQAGWKVEGDGYRKKDGKTFELTLMTTSQNKTRELVQTFIQSELKKAGIKINIKNEPARVFFGETLSKIRWDGMAMFAWVSSPDSPPRTTLHSNEIPSDKNAFTGQNYVGFSNPRVDQILDDVRKELSLDNRKQLMSELQKIYAEEVPVLPLFMRSEIAVLPLRLQNYKPTGHQYSPSIWAEMWSFTPTSTH